MREDAEVETNSSVVFINYKSSNYSHKSLDLEIKGILIKVLCNGIYFFMHKIFISQNGRVKVLTGLL